jgi:hypothetical protein
MKEGKSILILLVLFVFVVYVMRRFLGHVSAFLFVPIDKLLFISHSIPPVVMWTLLGLLIGLICGSFIAIKKYKLDFKLLGYPIGILLFSIALILMVSHFFNKKNNKTDDTTSNITLSGGTNPRKTSARENEKFSDALRRGIEAVKNEDYQDAENYFKKAALTDKDNSQLDSLARIYAATAKEKCKMFARDPQLKYIPDHYYKYVAALTNTPAQICK